MIYYLPIKSTKARTMGVNTAALNHYLDGQNKADQEYQSRQDADWGDIEKALGESLPEAIDEAIGVNATDGRDWSDKWRKHCHKIFDCIATGDDAELGRLVRGLAAPYLIKQAQATLERQGKVKAEIDDLLSFLEVSNES